MENRQTLTENRSMSRFEAQLFLFLAIEARFPKLLFRKALLTGAPLDIGLLHQSVLRNGGYRWVEYNNLWEQVTMTYLNLPSNSYVYTEHYKVRTLLRDKALKHLLWIEDEVSPVLVNELQTLAKKYAPNPIPLDHNLSGIPAELRGGNKEDLPEWFYRKHVTYTTSAGLPGLSVPTTIDKEEYILTPDVVRIMETYEEHYQRYLRNKQLRQEQQRTQQQLQQQERSEVSSSVLSSSLSTTTQNPLQPSPSMVSIGTANSSSSSSSSVIDNDDDDRDRDINTSIINSTTTTNNPRITISNPSTSMDTVPEGDNDSNDEDGEDDSERDETDENDDNNDNDNNDNHDDGDDHESGIPTTESETETNLYGKNPRKRSRTNTVEKSDTYTNTNNSSLLPSSSSSTVDIFSAFLTHSGSRGEITSTTTNVSSSSSSSSTAPTDNENTLISRQNSTTTTNDVATTLSSSSSALSKGTTDLVSFSSSSVDTSSPSSIVSHTPFAPALSYTIVVDSTTIHARDAELLYKFYAPFTHLAGANATHFPPSDITDDEEAAFPFYSRYAHASTAYLDANRKDVIRYDNHIFVIPSLGDRSEFMVGYATPTDRDFEKIVTAISLGTSLSPLPFPPGNQNLGILRNATNTVPNGTLPNTTVANPPVPKLLVHIPSYLHAVTNDHADPENMDTYFRRRQLTKEIIANHLLEGIPDQEPWIGYGWTRTQFLIDIRNHILLKWVQSQNPDPKLQYQRKKKDEYYHSLRQRYSSSSINRPTNRSSETEFEEKDRKETNINDVVLPSNLVHEVDQRIEGLRLPQTAPSSTPTTANNTNTSLSFSSSFSSLDMLTSKHGPTHPTWGNGTKYEHHQFGGLASSYVAIDNYEQILPLAFYEVVETIPTRFHEIFAAVFTYLESKGKINIGAIQLYRKEKKSCSTTNTTSLSSSSSTSSFGSQGLSSSSLSYSSLTRYRIPWSDTYISSLGTLPLYTTLPKFLIPRILHQITDYHEVKQRIKGPLPGFQRKRIAIIGAGIAGIAAARQLIYFGHDVVILEARNRPGGRISSNRNYMGIAVDEGAMISTGDEPNPVALLARQLNLRQHIISNLSSPLLLPKKYFYRITSMAIAREARHNAIETLYNKYVKPKTKPSSSSSTTINSSSSSSSSSFSTGGRRNRNDVVMDFNDDVLQENQEALVPRTVHGVYLDDTLCHVPNAFIHQAIRIHTVHATLMSEHLLFLRRLYKHLTALTMAQIHDLQKLPLILPSNAGQMNGSRVSPQDMNISSVTFPSYGVFVQGRPIPLPTENFLTAILKEMEEVQQWLTIPVETQVLSITRQAAGLDMLTTVGHSNKDGTNSTGVNTGGSRQEKNDGQFSSPTREDKGKTLTSLTPTALSPSSTSIILTENNDIKTYDEYMKLLRMDKLPWVVPVPYSLDTEIEQEFNTFLEKAHKLRKRSTVFTPPYRADNYTTSNSKSNNNTIPPENYFTNTFPLLRGNYTEQTSITGNNSLLGSSKGSSTMTTTSSVLTNAILKDSLIGNDITKRMIPSLPSAPPGYVFIGNEIILKETAILTGCSIPNETIVYTANQAIELATAKGIIDPYLYNFTPAIDGGLIGHGIDHWNMDTYPRYRTPKYLDPRRTDDNVDGVYELIYGAKPVHNHSSETPSASSTATKEAFEKVRLRRGRKTRSTAERQSTSSSNIRTPRVIDYGPVTQWDVSLLAALEKVITQEDTGWTYQSSNQNSVTQEKIDKIRNALPHSSTRITYTTDTHYLTNDVTIVIPLIVPRRYSNNSNHVTYLPYFDPQTKQLQTSIVTVPEKSILPPSNHSPYGSVKIPVFPSTTVEINGRNNSNGSMTESTKYITLPVLAKLKNPSVPLFPILGSNGVGSSSQPYPSLSPHAASTSNRAGATIMNDNHPPCILHRTKMLNGNDIGLPSLRSEDADTDGMIAKGMEGYQRVGNLPNPTSDSLTYAELRRAILRWHTANLEYGCASGLGNVSLMSWDQDDLFNYHDSGSHAFLKDGYDTHIRGLIKDLPIVYGTEVTQIEYGTKENSIPLSSSSSTDSRNSTDTSTGVRITVKRADIPVSSSPIPTATIDADAVLVTVPIGVLQENTIQFKPPLPPWKQEAIRSIGSGLLNKVILRFSKPFWRKQNPSTEDVELNQRKEKDLEENIKNGRILNGNSEDSDTVMDGTPITGTVSGKIGGTVNEGFNYTGNRNETRNVSNALIGSSVSTTKYGKVLNRSRYRKRPVSMVPFLERIVNHFHLQSSWLSDPHLLIACAIALQTVNVPYSLTIVPEKSLLPTLTGPAADERSAPLFAAIDAVAEAKGDVLTASRLLFQWYGNPSETSINNTNDKYKSLIAKLNLPDLSRPTTVDTEWETKAVISGDLANKLFHLPTIPPPGTKVLPTNGTSTVTGDNNISKIDGSSGGTVPIDIAVAERVNTEGISMNDDGFGRVTIGDSPVTIGRRGEAYMFWAMDRAGKGARIFPLGTMDKSTNRSTLPEWARKAYDAAQNEEVPTDSSHVLIAMMAGDAADWVEKASDNEVVRAVISALQELFGEDTVPNEPLAHIVTRWKSDRFARGSYSYVLPGSHGAHYDAMAAPVENTLFFAGEATNRHHPTTAAGAYDSGIREAVRMGQQYGRCHDPDVLSILTERERRMEGIRLAYLHREEIRQQERQKLPNNRRMSNHRTTTNGADINKGKRVEWKGGKRRKVHSQQRSDKGNFLPKNVEDE